LIILKNKNWIDYFRMNPLFLIDQKHVLIVVVKVK
jgi:hypothetical protein